jgi:hypothetical protein
VEQRQEAEQDRVQNSYALRVTKVNVSRGDIGKHPVNFISFLELRLLILSHHCKIMSKQVCELIHVQVFAAQHTQSRAGRT